MEGAPPGPELRPPRCSTQPTTPPPTSVPPGPKEGGEDAAAGGPCAPAMEASSTGCSRAPETEEADALSHPVAPLAGHTPPPPPELSNLASYKLTVTYAARSYTGVLGEFTKVSAWSWETNTEKKSSYEQFVRFLHDQWPWSDQESIVFSWWSCSNKFFVIVRSDDHVVNMFDDNEDSKHIKIVVQFCKKGEEDQLVNTLVEPIPLASSFKKSEQTAIVEGLTNNSQQQQDEYEEENHIGVDEEFTMYSDGEDEDDVATNEAGQHGFSDVEEDVEEDSEVEVHERSEEDSDDDDDETTDEEDSDGGVPEDIPVVHYDKENPSFTKGSLFPSIAEFRVALSTHAVKGEFNYKTIKSDRKRVRVKCASGKKCKWRVNGFVLSDGCTVQVRNKPVEHKCQSKRRDEKVKAAKRKWIAAHVIDWLKTDPTLTAKALQKKLFEKYHVEIHYQRVFAGRRIALEQIFGKWEDSFQIMYNFQAELLRNCPTSVVEINHKEIDGVKRFSRAFVCLRACIDGFLTGCRPYLSVDATALYGKWKGQLAIACGVDGHSWLYPVAYAVFDSETSENWDWFMSRLKSAIGTPEGLVICTDACKGLETAVHTVFPQAEHRECFRHMIINFRKKFHGEVFKKNMWPAAYTYSPAKYEHHMRAVEEANPAAIEYLKTWHPNLWSRSKFSAACKCDYVMNNIAESFNSMIRKLRPLPVLDLLDTMRQWIMVRWSKRAAIARKFAGKKILPSVKNMMNNRSRGIVLDSLSRSSDFTAEVAVRIHGYSWRHTVDLEKRECSCRRWQISGLPCLHAIAFITSIRGGHNIEHYVHDYYSVQNFSNAYKTRVPTMTDKKQWPKVDVGFNLFPPVLKKASGRPREKRIKAPHESISRKRHKCKQCKEYGHMLKTCPQLYPEGKPRNRKRKNVDPIDIDTNLEDVDITQELAADTHLQQSTQTPQSARSKSSATSKKKGGGKRAKCRIASGASYLPPLPQGSPIPAGARKGTTATPDSPASNTRSKKSKKSPPATSTRSKKKLQC